MQYIRTQCDPYHYTHTNINMLKRIKSNAAKRAVMSLSEYTGQTPPGFDTHTRIQRINPHQLWDRRGNTTESCINCQSEIRLSERHLIARLSQSPSGDRVTTRYLCDERCTHEWFEHNG